MHWNPAVGIPLLVVGLIVLVLIWLFGQPRKPGQVRRQSGGGAGIRREPTLGDVSTPDMDSQDAPEDDDEVSSLPPFQASLLASGAADDPTGDTSSDEKTRDLGQDTGSAPREVSFIASRAPTQVSSLGQRPEGLAVDRIIAINVVAPEDRWFQGADLIVAADKAGLEFGHKGIFHRMLDGKREMGPLFSVANMLQPGSFDLSQVVELSTTGLSFFMTLPGPVSALDAWEAMLPTAQRMAELLGGEVLDDEHNALGRQRIAHIRDNLRAWDRRHLGGEVGFDSR
jgi:cell division protein ZipA